MSDGLIIARGPSNVRMRFKPVLSLPSASQAEAEAGLASNKGMTPLRTAQAIEAQVPDLAVVTELVADITNIEILLSDEVKLRDFTRGINDPATRLTAVQAALDSAKAVIMDEEVVEVAGTILPRSGNSIIGRGRDASRFKLLRSGGAYVVPVMSILTDRTNVRLSGIGIDGNIGGLVQPTLGNMLAYGALCALLVGGENAYLEGVGVYNSFDNGIGIGHFTLTGTGDPGSPLTATQSAALPQQFQLIGIHGENCGSGVHDGQFGENGRKGAVVNVLTASNGTIVGLTGKANYNGLIVDYAGGASCSVASVEFVGTLKDPTYANGSGTDLYCGSTLNISSFRSQGAAGTAVYFAGETAYVMLEGVQVHACEQTSVLIEGGFVSGDIMVTSGGLSSANAYDGVKVFASDGVTTIVNLDIISNGSFHRYGYSSGQSGSGKVTGAVRLVAPSWATGAASRGGSEVVVEHNDVRARQLGRTVYEATSTADVVGDTSNNFAVAVQAAGTSKRVAAIYDLANDQGVLQAVEPGVAKKKLAFNPAGGAVQVGTGLWYEPVYLGGKALWIDAVNKLRIKASAPASDTDGATVAEAVDYANIYPADYANVAASVAAALAASKPLVLRPGDSATVNVAASGGDFTTLAAAFSAVRSWSVPAGATLTIQVADGTYSFSAALDSRHRDSRRIRVRGNVTTPANCKLQVSTNSITLFTSGPAQYLDVDGFEVKHTNSSDRANTIAFLADEGGTILLGANMVGDGFFWNLFARRGGSAIRATAGGTYKNGGDTNVLAYQGGHVDAAGCILTGANDALSTLGSGAVAEGGTLDLTGATLTGNKRAGLHLIEGYVRVGGSDFSSNTNQGVLHEEGVLAFSSSCTAGGNGGYGYLRNNGGGGTVTGSGDLNSLLSNGGAGANVSGLFRPYSEQFYSSQPGVHLVSPNTNESARWDAKGTGSHFFNTGGGSQVEIANAASAVSRLRLTGSAAGGTPKIDIATSDTNAALDIYSRGSGGINLGSGNGLSLAAYASASAVNYMGVRGRPTGGMPAIEALGSDTNIDIRLTPKGTGRIQIDTASAAATTPGNFTADRMLEIKDSSGTVYRVPCRASAW